MLILFTSLALVALAVHTRRICDNAVKEMFAEIRDQPVQARNARKTHR